MTNLLIILFGFIGIMVFRHLRKQSELANKHILRYCEEQNLQWLSTAAIAIGWQPHKSSLFRYKFNFEFSSSGANCYQGTLIMLGPIADQFILPPYAIDE